jgi:hypothetical protein
MCNIHALLTNGVLREVEQADTPDEDFTAESVVLYFLAFCTVMLNLF